MTLARRRPVPEATTARAVPRSPHRSAGPVLTREAVVEAAVAIAHRDGLDALSMRVLGNELGVSTMAAYRYVDGKDAVVDEVLEVVLGKVDPVVDRAAPWQEQVAELAERSYAAFLTVPGATRFLRASTLTRPGITAWLEVLIRPVADAGITFEERLGFTGALVWQITGAVELELERRALPDGAADPDAVATLRAAVRLLADGLGVRVAV